jgi:glucosylceramidase
VAGQGGRNAAAGTKSTAIGDGGSQTGGSSGAPAAGGTPAAGGSSGGDLPTLVTSADNAFWKVGTFTEVTSGTADVTANESTKNQRWDGFGGCFNEAGWDALSVLSEADRQLAITLLFDAASGANFAYGRLPIGASDYAMSRYTLDETANDYTMDKFSIDRDKEKLIPYIKAAVAVKPGIHLWASPWTPPAWMKDNNDTDSGNMKDDDKVLDAFALYLAKFVEEYAKVDLKIEAIHPQNEPGYLNLYPSCKWSSDLFIRFIKKYLGPKFAERNVTAEIWCGTMSAPDDGTIATTAAKDADAMKYIKGFGLQWNTKDKVSTLKGTNLPIMQTEHKCGNYSFASDYWDQSRYDANKPQNDLAYGVESWKNMRDWINAGVNSYSAWNLVLDTSGANLNSQKVWHQDALLTVDRTAKKLIQTPAYYVFRHLSQFVHPNATRIGTTGGDALAFKNEDGSTVVVMYNEGSAKKAIVAVGSTKLQFDMPANGWATINYKK